MSKALIESIINGILMGGLYGFMAVGLTLIFGIVKVINFAHGSFIMVGMFVGYWFFVLTGIDPYLSLLIIVPVLFILGYYVQKFLIKPMLISEAEEREPIGILVLTAGLWLFLDNLALLLFGPNFRTVSTRYTGVTFETGGVLISTPRLYAFLISLALMGVLYFALKKTRIGKAVRATGQDRRVATLMAVDIYRIYNIAFATGIALTGAMGALLVPFYPVYPSVGFVFDIRGFMIVVLGGLGNIQGALLAGLIIGLIESVGAQFMETCWTAGLIFLIFLLVLYFKPEGMFGFKGEW